MVGELRCQADFQTYYCIVEVRCKTLSFHKYISSFFFICFFGWLVLFGGGIITPTIQRKQFYLKYSCCWCCWPEREDGKVSWFWNGILQLNVPTETVCHLLTLNSPAVLLERNSGGTKGKDDSLRAEQFTGNSNEIRKSSATKTHKRGKWATSTPRGDQQYPTTSYPNLENPFPPFLENHMLENSLNVSAMPTPGYCQNWPWLVWNQDRKIKRRQSEGKKGVETWSGYSVRAHSQNLGTRFCVTTVTGISLYYCFFPACSLEDIDDHNFR